MGERDRRSDDPEGKAAAERLAGPFPPSVSGLSVFAVTQADVSVQHTALWEVQCWALLWAALYLSLPQNSYADALIPGAQNVTMSEDGTFKR